MKCYLFSLVGYLIFKYKNSHFIYFLFWDTCTCALVIGCHGNGKHSILDKKLYLKWYREFIVSVSGLAANSLTHCEILLWLVNAHYFTAMWMKYLLVHLQCWSPVFESKNKQIDELFLICFLCFCIFRMIILWWQRCSVQQRKAIWMASQSFWQRQITLISTSQTGYVWEVSFVMLCKGLQYELMSAEVKF